MAVPNIQSRIKGSIFGVAVTDALGGPVEFMPRGVFPEVTGFRHNETFDVPPGTWTDDTSMTLCLAQALIDAKGGDFVPQAAIRNYVNWFKNGYLSATGDCFDIGAGTTKALMIWDEYLFSAKSKVEKDDPVGHEGGQPLIDKALKREMFCGNGSLMRVAPIGLVYHRDLDLALCNAALSSDATHPYPTCAECCMLYTRLIVNSLKGATKETLASEIACIDLRDPKLRDRLSRYKGIEDWVARDESGIKSSGYVVSTIEASLWAFFTTNSFRKGALKVVNLGDDADTVGAVFGGIAGAYYGFESIPEEWIEGLQKKEVVAEIADGLASLSK
ncbi:hypothetical protein FQN54_002536 [Arachnomyces sp. PD_36]|nr:hypothetical protein FQN54_002536 [Arachnomyces sp. PD_36]